MTTIYLMRHSKPFMEHDGEMKSNDSVQLINEKYPLSIDGERLAEKVAAGEEFRGIDTVWSSNYVRTMSTAKYFAYNNGIKVNVDDRLGERKQGILTWDELPKDFFVKQFLDEDYKIRNGECARDVTKRMQEVVLGIVKDNLGKRVLIVSHNAAITMLLKSWCNATIDTSNKELTFEFNNERVFKGKLDYCETFKLEFDDNLVLKNVSHVVVDRL